MGLNFQARIVEFFCQGEQPRTQPARSVRLPAAGAEHPLAPDCREEVHAFAQTIAKRLCSRIGLQHLRRTEPVGSPCMQPLFQRATRLRPWCARPPARCAQWHRARVADDRLPPRWRCGAKPWRRHAGGAGSHAQARCRARNAPPVPPRPRPAGLSTQLRAGGRPSHGSVRDVSPAGGRTRAHDRDRAGRNKAPRACHPARWSIPT